MTLVVMTLASCADAESDPAAGPPLGPGSSYRVPDDRDVQIYFRSMIGVNEAVSEINFSESLIEHLPGQEFVVNGQKPLTLSRGVVVGRVRQVSPGQAYAVPRGRIDAGRGEPVGYEDPRAEWRIARLRIDVDQWFATGPAPDSVEVGAFVAHPRGALGDAERRGLNHLGEVIVVLDPTRSYSWDTGVIPIARGGVLLGDIDQDGQIGFPGLGAEGGDFVGGATLGDLARASRETTAPIQIAMDLESGVLTRK